MARRWFRGRVQGVSRSFVVCARSEASAGIACVGRVNLNKLPEGSREGPVAGAVGLVDGFLHYFGARDLDEPDGGVAVVGDEDETAQEAIGQEVFDHVPVRRRDIGIVGGRVEEEPHVRLGRRVDAHPSCAVGSDGVAYLEAEHVGVEVECRFDVVGGESAGPQFEIRAGQRRSLSPVGRRTMSSTRSGQDQHLL